MAENEEYISMYQGIYQSFFHSIFKDNLNDAFYI